MFQLPNYFKEYNLSYSLCFSFQTTLKSLTQCVTPNITLPWIQDDVAINSPMDRQDLDCIFCRNITLPCTGIMAIN